MLIVVAFYIEGVYRLPRGTGYLNEFYRLLNAVTTITIIVMVGNYMFQPPYHSRLVYGIAGVLILLFHRHLPPAQSPGAGLVAAARASASGGCCWSARAKSAA